MQITDPLLTAREGAAFLQISIPTFWRRVADGTVPAPIRLGGLSRWPQSEIAAVIEQAKACRRLRNDAEVNVGSDGCASAFNEGGRK